jgi:hypothetical protein
MLALDVSRRAIFVALVVALLLAVAACSGLGALQPSDNAAPTEPSQPSHSVQASASDAQRVCKDGAGSLDSVGIVGGPDASVAAAYTTNLAALAEWKKKVAVSVGASSTPVAGESAGQNGHTAEVTLCYFDGDFGPPRGPSAPDSIGDYTRVAVVFDAEGKLTPLVAGFVESMPLIDPNSQ